MLRSVWLVLVVLLLPVFAFAQAPPPKDAPKDTPSKEAPSKDKVKEAEQHFFRGNDLFGDGDYANAALEFKRAYEAMPDWHVLYNVGQCCFLAADYACALDAFTKYLADGGKQIPAVKRVQVEKDIKTCGGRIAKLEIKTSVPGATISVDDEKRGTSPLDGALTVSQGKRKVTATKEGYDPATEVVEIAGGENKSVELTLKEIVKKDTSPPPPPPKPQQRSILPWIGVGVTGALLVGTVITGIVAINASDKANNRLQTFGANPMEIKNLESDASTFALVTDILGVATIAVGVTTAVLFFVESRPPKEKKASITPLFGLGAIGVRGTF